MKEESRVLIKEMMKIEKHIEPCINAHASLFVERIEHKSNIQICCL